MSRSEFNPAPIGVGGVGGSGTRLIASLLESMGMFMGSEVNESNDSLLWPPFRKLLHDNASGAQAPREQVLFDALTLFERQMHETWRASDSHCHNWFWKVPTTFYWLEPVSRYFPGMRYIHVIRHGLDMAFTSNVRQMRVWARAVDMKVSQPITPDQVLTYWVRANALAVERARTLLGERFYLLDYDHLCTDPVAALRQLATFLGLEPTGAELTRWSALVDKPASIGRHQHYDCRALFDAALLQSVAGYGYAVPDA